MKNILLVVLALGSFATHAAELQLQECKFRNSLIEFTPSSALTTMLSKDVKGAVVYKVKYKKGSMQTGPKTDLAVMDELPSKTLGVSFFEHDEENGVVFKNHSISIDLKSPVSTDAPVIGFESQLLGPDGSRGKCLISL